MSELIQNTTDLVIIGAGPGGYVAAIRASQLGMKTIIIDKRSTLGGTCLNVGCIPSKALLQSSCFYYQAINNFDEHGISASLKLDLIKMMHRKNKIVKDLEQGIRFLMRKNKINVIHGRAVIDHPRQVSVISEYDTISCKINCERILIATGSRSKSLPDIDVDEKNIVTSTGALNFTQVPNHLLIIGAGAIGLELGSVWSRLGSKVEVIEFLDYITPNVDLEIARNFQKILEKQNFKFRTKTKVLSAQTVGSIVEVIVDSVDGDNQQLLKFDKVLLCIGRCPCTADLGLDKIGVITSNCGTIKVDKDYQTNISGIYAIGDCIPGPMLAHKAEDEAIAVVERMIGHATNINYNTVPEVIYTDPEVAKVGQTEEMLKQRKITYKIGKFPFSANSRARISGQDEGVVKIIADAQSDEILGAHILGTDAGTIIHEVACLMEFSASAEDLARCTHAHPTLTEAVKEAALAACGQGSIHI